MLTQLVICVPAELRADQCGHVFFWLEAAQCERDRGTTGIRKQLGSQECDIGFEVAAVSGPIASVLA